MTLISRQEFNSAVRRLTSKLPIGSKRRDAEDMLAHSLFGQPHAVAIAHLKTEEVMTADRVIAALDDSARDALHLKLASAADALRALRVNGRAREEFIARLREKLEACLTADPAAVVTGLAQQLHAVATNATACTIHIATLDGCESPSRYRDGAETFLVDFDIRIGELHLTTTGGYFTLEATEWDGRSVEDNTALNINGVRVLAAADHFAGDEYGSGLLEGLRDALDEALCEQWSDIGRTHVALSATQLRALLAA